MSRLDRRLKSPPAAGGQTPDGIGLPKDFSRMVEAIYEKNFDAGLKLYGKFRSRSRFRVSGAIHSNEIVVAISILSTSDVVATTVYASCDFDPNASAPKAEDVLGLCVDAVGSIYTEFLDPKKPERIRALANSSLAAFEDIPFEWTEVNMGGKKLFLKVDKTNPEIEEMTEDWLEKNDPDRAKKKSED